LRVSEACGLKLDQVDTESRVPHPSLFSSGGWEAGGPTRNFVLVGQL